MRSAGKPPLEPSSDVVCCARCVFDQINCQPNPEHTDKISDRINAGADSFRERCDVLKPCYSIDGAESSKEHDSTIYALEQGHSAYKQAESSVERRPRSNRKLSRDW